MSFSTGLSVPDRDRAYPPRVGHYIGLNSGLLAGTHGLLFHNIMMLSAEIKLSKKIEQDFEFDEVGKSLSKEITSLNSQDLRTLARSSLIIQLGLKSATNLKYELNRARWKLTGAPAAFLYLQTQDERFRQLQICRNCPRCSRDLGIRNQTTPPSLDYQQPNATYVEFTADTRISPPKVKIRSPAVRRSARENTGLHANQLLRKYKKQFGDDYYQTKKASL
ncbi:hypothetical protein TWF481_002992 [Arthrobotrys musiformis]|uniref:Uncharacterized protein n=1 Tax=Arthrobotrys musiformis TaxID=47236 RepID=A0AAV9VT42_9PEZI